MPYNSISDLPDQVKEALPSSQQRQRFMGAFNSCMYDDGGDETRCFKVGYAAAKKSDLPTKEACKIAKERLPGWAYAVLQTQAYHLPPNRVVRKSSHSLVSVFKVFSFATVQHLRGKKHKMGTVPEYAKAIVEQLNNRDLIEKALDVSRDTLPGWAYATLHKIHQAPKAPLIFMVNKGDLQTWTEPVNEVIEQVYLPLMGEPDYTIITPDDPTPHGVRVALGKLGNGATADATLPHPAALLEKGDRGEVARKALLIKNLLDTLSERTVASGGGVVTPDTPDNCQGLPQASDSRVIVPISKVDSEKQIVTGVVLQPWATDSQQDVVTPNTIEDASFEYMASSRAVGINHTRKAKGAVVVESYLVPYPTKADYDKAMKGADHNAYQLKVGEDVVTSGSWVMSTKLNAPLWGAFKKGEFEAYSIGGYGKRAEHTATDIPRITFVRGN